jgi:RNA recognition motif-containing protein
MNIHVSNLSLNTIDSDLKKLFETYGTVNTAVIVRDKWKGRSLGTAVIDMLNSAEASLAIKSLHNTMLHGKQISVSEIKYSIKDNLN